MRPTDEKYINSLPKQSRRVIAELIVIGKSKKWLADELGITFQALMYKLKDPDRFQEHELEKIRELIGGI